MQHLQGEVRSTRKRTVVRYHLQHYGRSPMLRGSTEVCARYLALILYKLKYISFIICNGYVHESSSLKLFFWLIYHVDLCKISSSLACNRISILEFTSFPFMFAI